MKFLELPLNITPDMVIEAFKGEGPDWVYLDSSDEINPYSEISVIGFKPFLTISYKKNILSLNWENGKKDFSSDFWTTMRELLDRFEISDPINTDLPEFPTGAAIGYLSYDLGMELEGIFSSAKPGFGWPLLELAFYDLLFCFAIKKGKNIIISTGHPCIDLKNRERRARERLDYALRRLQHVISQRQRDGFRKGKDFENRLSGPNQKLGSNFDRESYIIAIQRIKSYISAGDVYQVNLSQSFSGESNLEGLDIYQYIRRYNRVPFGGYLCFADREILCFSMERLLRMKGKNVETRPIKGTRPRGKNAGEDRILSQELFKSPKDRAELVMIVDMERNDLGRVCRPGSVRVKRLFEVERYATVFHLVATIRGELEDNADQLDCIRACLPGGSITGAPKIRAMEIIDELEGIKREVYCGAIGYFGFNGVSDFNIPIRTIFKEGNKIRFNAGGGILYDSNPELEYAETLYKVRSFLDFFNKVDQRPFEKINKL